jgi:hypothetical protein
MIRLAALAAAAVAAVSIIGACTLLLPTDTLIVPCQSQADCDEKVGDGFVCDSNACLPEDDAATSG